MKFHHRGTINTELATERKNRKNPERDKEEKEKSYQINLHSEQNWSMQE